MDRLAGHQGTGKESLNMYRFSYMLIDSAALLATDYEALFAFLADCGYEGVELNLTPPLIDAMDRLESALDAHGLAVSGLLTGTAYNEGLCLSVPDAAVRQRTVDRLIGYLPLAQRLDAILVVGLLQGFLSDESDTAVANDRIAEGLGEVCKAATEQGVQLVIEPINHLQVGFNNSVAEVRQMAARIGSPALGPMVDTIHMNIEETSLIQPIYDCGADLRHVHLCESDGGPLAGGHIDFKSVLEALDRIGYDGFAAVKVYRKAGVRASAQQGLEYLRQLLAEDSRS